MSGSLDTVAPAFVDMAHRIVWCVGATVDRSGGPRTRVLHPIWEWDGNELVGWIATSPLSPKGKHLDRDNRISLTYWQVSQDTCTADCTTEWRNDPESRRSGWERFKGTPEPLGFDPSIIPQWPSPDAPEFGILRLSPTALSVMPGSLLTQGEGEFLSWRA